MSLRAFLPAAITVSLLATLLLTSVTASAETPPSPSITTTPPLPAPSDPTCALDHYIGVTYEDAVAIEEILCSEAKSRRENGARYHVRVSKLGHQTIVRLVVDHNGGASGGGKTNDRQLVISSAEEITVAAPRLVSAALDEKPVAQTQNVDNVVGGEVRTAKSQKARVNGTIGVVGAGMMGADPSAGMVVGVSAGDARWSFVTDLRLTGDSFESGVSLPLQVLALGLWKPKLSASSSFGSLTGGIRHHFSADSTSLFASMGIGLDHVGMRQEGTELKNTGLGASAEVGLDVLRTSSVGGTVAFRFDAPFFAVTGQRAIEPSESVGKSSLETVQRWTPVASVAFAMRF